MELILVGDGNIVRTLRPNIQYKIITDDAIEGPDCAVIPIKGHSLITSKGLMYDMGNNLILLMLV